MTENPSIQQTINNVRRTMGAVGKDGFNQHGNFKFRGIDAIINALSPAATEHGLIIMPRVLERVEGIPRATAKGGTMNVTHLHIEFTFTGPAGDSLVASMWGEGADSGDKSTSKAAAMAMKYALVQALSIPTDDPDPDSTSHEAAPVKADPDLQAAKQALWKVARGQGMTVKTLGEEFAKTIDVPIGEATAADLAHFEALLLERAT